MAPKFGTSGLRGLVTDLNEPLVRSYVRAFLHSCETGQRLFVGRDLRPSSPQIAQWVMAEASAAGLPVLDCGALPTPALALAAKGHCAIMVTGSHIPADRNGLKFYVPTGEISKADETRILAAIGSPPPPTTDTAPVSFHDATKPYMQRYAHAFGTALTGLRVGVYQHSSVARDVMVEVMQSLGAKTVSISRSETFIPVDTEALDLETQTLFSGWFAEHGLDVLISTDGDADRPMMVDDQARVVPGDVLGTLTARTLDAGIICTPISSNTQVDSLFPDTRRTRIGSPHVIAAMEQALNTDPAARVIGYEANGGFLLGFTAQAPHGPLEPLMTRDCLLPLIAPLVAAQAQNTRLSTLWDALPARFTAADRLQGIAPEVSATFLQTLSNDATARATFFSGMSPTRQIDQTDGLRLTFDSGDIIHLRPSGNAPEFRCYTEAAARSRATDLLTLHLDKLRDALT